MLLVKQPIGTMAYMGGLQFVFEEFMWSFAQTVAYGYEFVSKASQNTYVHLERATSSDRAMSRNYLSYKFLGDWLIMFDADHAWEPDILGRMLALFEAPLADGSRVDVLSALYRYKTYPHLPVCFHWDESEQGHSVIGKFLSEAPLFQIGCAGAGTLLIRRSVFDRIRAELGEDPFAEVHPFSEDFSFFARCRKLGIPVYVAPKIESDHLVVKRITGKDFDPAAVEIIPVPQGGVASVQKASVPIVRPPPGHLDHALGSAGDVPLG